MAEKNIANVHWCFPRKRAEEQFLSKPMLFLQQSASTHTRRVGSAEEELTSSPLCLGKNPSPAYISSSHLAWTYRREARNAFQVHGRENKAAENRPFGPLTSKNKGSLMPQSNKFGFLELFCINFPQEPQTPGSRSWKFTTPQQTVSALWSDSGTACSTKADERTDALVQVSPRPQIISNCVNKQICE